MKQESNRNRFLQTIGISLLSLILALSTILPSALLPVVSAADGSSEIQVNMKVNDIETNKIPVQTINDGDVKFVFTLSDTDRTWASDIETTAGKKQLIIDAFGELANKLSLSSSISADFKTLTVTASQATSFTLDNEIFKINFSAALIENWPGKVNPIELEILSKPSLSIEGSINNGTTIEDIQKGGKTIELRLVNATWKPDEIAKISNYNNLLDSFTANSGKWDVAQALKKVDPNDVISYSNEDRTLHLKLPAVPNAAYTSPITFNMIDGIFAPGAPILNSWLYTVDSVANIGDSIKNSPVNFTISDGRAPNLSVTPVLNETNIKNGGTILKLTLSNTSWASDLGIGNSQTTKAKNMLLIDSIQAKDQKDQWDIVKAYLKDNNVTRINDVVTIRIPEIPEIPETEKLLLSKDQVLSVKIPYQLLEQDVKLPEQRFTIKAQPKVLLSGTATPSMPQVDLAKGGKTIVLTLVNATWDSDIASSTTKREELLSRFTWGSPAQSTSINSVLLARADVKRTNERTVTIKLPAISEKFYGKIVFEPDASLVNIINDPDIPVNSVPNIGALLTNKLDFKIDEVQNQSATISGTATNKINDLDIVQGSKTVVITLKNDTWQKSLSNDIEFKSGLEGSPMSLGYSLVRTNDTTVTLTLDKKSGFSINKDVDVNITIPNNMLSARTSNLEVKSAFKISPIASLSGTGTSMDPVDVIKGRKTIIVTLNNAEFKDLNSIPNFLTKHVDSAVDIPGEWSNLTDYKISKNTLTVTLPASPSYATTGTAKFNVNISSDWLKNYTINPPVRVNTGQVAIGATATASINRLSFTEAAIKQGNSILSITLNGTDWDQTIETNASKKSALMKGLTVSDQSKEWGLVTTAIAKSGTFQITGKTLKITLPSIPDYSIVRDQKVSVTIPKTVLNGYKYDIPTNQVLSITVPDLANETSFTELLDSGLADFIEQHKIENIRVAVPKKNVDKFTTYVSDLGTHKIATVNVYTSSAAAKVTATLISNEGEVTRTIERNVNNLFTLVFDDMKDDSTLHITVKNSSDEVIQEVFQKVAKGNKTYTVAPKTPLDGKYSLYSLLTEKSLLTNILKYYSLEDLKIGTTNN